MFFATESATAFPIYAQQAYANPREANGRIACANCHLAQKPVEIETPQAVLPNSIFEAVVKIPYDLIKFIYIVASVVSVISILFMSLDHK